jgi:hypothetical protein
LFASVSGESSLLPRVLDEEARGASDSESSTVAVLTILREVRRCGFGGGGEWSASLPLISGPADALIDALESESTLVNGKR